MRTIPPDNYEVFYKHAWLQTRNPPPIDKWMVKSGCETVARIYHEFGCASILEAASGLGLKALMFRHLDFEVVGTDICTEAVSYSRELAQKVDLDVEFQAISWAEIPIHFVNEFDAVYIDQSQNVRSRDGLVEAARAAHSALKPGGVYIFASREEGNTEWNAAELVEEAWEEKKTPRIWWTVQTDEGPVTTIEMCERFDEGIYHHFLHLHNNKKLEQSGWLENFRWPYEECKLILSEVGFSSVIEKKMPGRTRIACIGVK